MTDFIEPCYCFDGANLVDKIRQKVIDLQNNPSFEEIKYFLDGSIKYLENDLPHEVATELFSAIFTFFKIYTKELMPIFDEILKQSRTNPNYIYLTSLLLSYLTHADLNIKIPDYQSFSNDIIKEISQQITNQTEKLIIFGHEIAPQFQNDLILNSVLSATPIQSISPILLKYILYRYWRTNDKRLDSFLNNINKEGLNKIFPQTESSNEEILEFCYKKDDQIFLKMSLESFSIIKSAIIYLKCKSKEQLNELNQLSIFQFVAVISVLLKIMSDKIFILLNEIQIDVLKDSVNLISNINSPILFKFIDIILENWALLVVSHFIDPKKSFDFLDFLVQQLINNEYKSDKFYLINTYLNLVKYIEHVNSNQLSKLFSFIFSNLNDFYNCRNNFIYESFDLSYVDKTLIVNQFSNLKSVEEVIQKIYFFEKICFDQPSISVNTSILIKTIQHEIKNKNYDDLKLICRFLKRNDLLNENEQFGEMFNNLPLIIKYKLYDELPLATQTKMLKLSKEEDIKEKDIDDLLLNILTDDELIHNNYILKALFDLMMKDEDNLFCFLSYLVSQPNLPYKIDDYLRCFCDEYNKYHDVFLKVTNELFNFVKSENMLIIRNNFKVENFKISEFGVSIVSKIFNSLKENPVCNYQAFLCLQSIACTVPILFHSNIQQIFDSILEPFNNLYLLFENYNKDNKNLLLTKTAYASLSFLLSTFQSSLVLDHFVKWLFTNFDNFTNSQIFGFLFILRCLSNKNVAFYSFMPSTYKEYDLFNKVATLLNRKITEGPIFEKNYKESIFNFLERVFYGFSSFSPYVICQNESLSKIENKFTYFYSNIFSSFIKYDIYPINAIDPSIREFIHSINKKKNFWINFNIKDKAIDLNMEQLGTFIDELPHYERYIIPEKDKELNGPISIRMANYMVMKPVWIYDIILYKYDKVFSKEQSELYFTVIKELRELQEQARENPQEEENADVGILDSDEYFTPVIDRSDFINNLIDQIIFNVNVDYLKLVFCKMARYPIISKKIIQCLILKITEYSFNPLNIYHFIYFLKKTTIYCNFIEIFFDLFGNNLLNIILTPKCRNDSKLLIKAAECFDSISTKPPLRLIQMISFLILLKSDESILLALNLCKYFNEDELGFINDSLLCLFDDSINSENNNLLIALLNNAPFIINARKFESISLLAKEFDNYSSNKNEKSFNIICALLNALAPNRFNSTTLSNIIDSSSLIPSFIKETGTDFWNLYEQHIGMINEMLTKNPYLLNDKLKFLLNYPEIVDFRIRSSYFKKKMQNAILDNYQVLNFTVDYDNILESSFQSLHNLPPKSLLNKFRISVVNSIVVDLSGVTRDWFSNLAKELFNVNYGLFDCSKNMRGYKPSHNSFIHKNHLDYFKFAGMFIARALIEGVSIDAHLTSSFCKQILHRKTNLKDLEDIDNNLYQSCQSILENDANELYLTFSMNVDDLGEIKIIELKENGSKIPVTNENKVEFVNLKANYILYGQIKDQVDAFIAGFDSLIPHKYLRIFTPAELDLLICGVPTIDVNDFIENMTFIEPYNANTHVVKLFFDVIKNWGNEDLAKLLLFMTGSSRVPLNGFKEFVEITNERLKIGPGGIRENLPQAHTCFNELDLPEYQTKEELENKLRKAMEYSNSFGIA